MSKLLVFDSRATLDSAGNAISQSTDWAGAATPLTSAKSQPVRIFSGAGYVPVVGWEFNMMEFPAGGVAAVRWFQEFYSDVPSLDTPPNKRVWPDINEDQPWGREVVATSGGAGIVTLEAVTREMEMSQRMGDQDTLLIPLSVYSLWVRLRIWLSIADSTNIAANADIRLKVFAHVGGHDESKYMRENGTKPYAYNAFK